MVGSRNLQNFDPALVIYTFAVIFAAWGWSITTRSGFRSLRRGSIGDGGGSYSGSADLAQLRTNRRVERTQFWADDSSRNDQRTRWAMHQLIFWGCLLAVAITFPLVFGWINFTSAARRSDDICDISVRIPGVPFPSAYVHSGDAFHGLDISALLVLGGIALALWRRMTR